MEQVVGEAKTGDLCGEIGVLCYRPQLFTVRTKRLSQLLRMNRATFLNIIQANVGDGNVIMNNLLQVRNGIFHLFSFPPSSANTPESSFVLFYPANFSETLFKKLLCKRRTLRVLHCIQK